MKRSIAYPNLLSLRLSSAIDLGYKSQVLNMMKAFWKSPFAKGEGMKPIRDAIWIFFCLLGMTTVGWAKPDHLVVGCSCYWLDNIYPIENYNFDALTHITRVCLATKDNGDLVVPGSFFDDELEKRAHDHGVKMIAAVGGAAPDAKNWLSMATHPEYEKNFFDQLDQLLTSHHYDGVDIDWEPSALNDKDQGIFTAFLKDLRHRFPNWVIYTDLGGGNYWTDHVSWTEVADQVDFIDFTGYCFAGSWNGYSAYNSNLDKAKDIPDTGISDKERIHALVTKYHVPPEKIVLGIPFYGIQFFTKSMGTSFLGDPNDEGTEITYYEVAPLLTNKDYRVHWDDGAQVPYLERVKGGFEASYDDPRSIRLKCEFAARSHLKGVLIWTLGRDISGGKTPLMDAVAESFGAKPMNLPPEGLLKTVTGFAAIVSNAYTQLSADYNELIKAKKTEGAKGIDPGPQPDVTIPDSMDPKVLGGTLFKLQTLLTGYNRQLQDARILLRNLPEQEIKGIPLISKRNRFLLDDFEKSGNSNRLGGIWVTECDQNKLGTVMNPMPYQRSKGGSKKTPKHSAHIWGHLGRNVAPWAWADLSCPLSPSFAPVDISQFKKIEFWVKGNGKDYTAILGRSAVKDHATFQADFKAPAQWTKVSLTLADFKQPAWGRQIPLKLNDILFIAFSPAASFSDDDFDLWIDDITLVK